MKKMFRSFRIFTGAYTIRSTVMMLLYFVAVFGVTSMLSAIPVKEDSFAEGFFEGFLPAMSMFVPMTGVFLLNALYAYNLPSNPGYKYLHSIPGTARCYRDAIIMANVFAIIFMLVALGIHYIFFRLCGAGVSPVYCAFIALLAAGMINLFGSVRHQWVRFFVMMPLFIASGFLFGFSSAVEENEKGIPDIVMWIIYGVSLSVYVAGLIYTLATSEKKWSGGLCKD